MMTQGELWSDEELAECAVAERDWYTRYAQVRCCGSCRKYMGYMGMCYKYGTVREPTDLCKSYRREELSLWV
jgi:hypothetical protein